MSLEITGRVIDVLPEQTGTGQKGEWRKQEFILETPGQYPKQVCIVQWGDNIDKFGVAVGEELTAHIDLQSREYNGRWYTDVKAWRVDKSGEGSAADSAPDFDGPPEPLGPGDDGLPF